MEKSKTQQAIQLVTEGATLYAAAQQIGIATSTLYTALKRRQSRNLCPCCNQVIREGFEVNKSAVADNK